MHRLLLTLVILMGHFAQANEPRFTYCRLGKIVRTIRAEATPNGCRTIYTKAGIDRSVGSGKAWASCYKFLENVKGNLEEGSWKCRDLEKFKVFGSVPVIKSKSEVEEEKKKEGSAEDRDPSSEEPQAESTQALLKME